MGKDVESVSKVIVRWKNKCLFLKRSKEETWELPGGHLEVGEKFKDGAIREVFEEVSLKVNNINYYASQAWPFPSQLMLAYTCDYESGDIKVDGNEIVDAKWFDIDNLPNIRPNSTLSGRLINSYISDR